MQFAFGYLFSSVHPRDVGRCVNAGNCEHENPGHAKVIEPITKHDAGKQLLLPEECHIFRRGPNFSSHVSS
jgi:hypothetical protein